MKHFDDKFALLEHSLALAKQKGEWIECGVYSGETLFFIADRAKDRKVYGCDSFEGLPENAKSYGVWKPRLFSLNEQQRKRLSEDLKEYHNVILVEGWFEDTLAPLNKILKEITFVHIDSDLYESCQVILKDLSSKFVDGVVIQFDEYFNVSELQEQKAFTQWLDESKWIVEPLGRSEQQYAVRLRKVTA